MTTNAAPATPGSVGAALLTTLLQATDHGDFHSTKTYTIIRVLLATAEQSIVAGHISNALQIFLTILTNQA